MIGPAVEAIERVCCSPDFQRSPHAALHGGALAALRRNIALLNAVVTVFCEAGKVRCPLTQHPIERGEGWPLVSGWECVPT